MKITMLTCPDCGQVRYLQGQMETRHGETLDVFKCSPTLLNTCPNEGVAVPNDLDLEVNEAWTTVDVGGYQALAIYELDLPDFDMCEAAGFDGTLRTGPAPITWRMIAERMVETFGLEVEQ